MNYVSQLYNTHPGADIYVVGTGASLRVFPLSFLENKIAIGLNQAWKLLPVKYSITIRPELNIPEFMAGEAPREGITWITKFIKFTTPEQKEFAKAHAERFYYFESVPTDNKERLIQGQSSLAGRNLEWVRKPTENYLYVWSSISQAAVNLAANMGARNIILVGCDNAAVMNNHHAHGQHTMWAGNDPQARYQEYYQGLCEIRAVLRQRGITLISATPFLRVGDCEAEFLDLCQQLTQPAFIENRDISRRVGVAKKQKSSLFRTLRKLMASTPAISEGKADQPPRPTR